MVNTHLHFDHAGGNTRAGRRRAVPAFPRARYVVQMGEWEDATHPHERNRASYREENFVPLAEAASSRPCRARWRWRPACAWSRSAATPPTTRWWWSRAAARPWPIPTDLLPTTSHLPLPFVMGYDLFPVGTLEAKRRLLDRAARARTGTCSSTTTRASPLGRVRREGERYVLAEASA